MILALSTPGVAKDAENKIARVCYTVLAESSVAGGWYNAQIYTIELSNK
jgi:hypothetical protein